MRSTASSSKIAPKRSRVVVGRLRTFVDGQRGVEAVVVVVHLPDPLLPAIAPVARLVVEPLAGGAAVARIAVSGRPRGQADLVEEPLPDLVHGDELLEAGAADVDPGGAAEAERGVPRHHRRVGIGGAEAGRDVERRRIRQVLLHAGEVGADPQAGDQRAGVLAVGALQGHAARREGRLPHGRVEHAADLGIAGVAAAGEDDAPAGADGHRLAPLVDVPVLPVAPQQLPGLGVVPRRVVGPDADHPARERLLADEVREAAVQHELDALLARRELQRPG